MATNRRDVTLLVRAKDEASKAFDSAAAALNDLLSANDAVGASAQKAGTRLEELARLAVTLDKAYSQINSSADAAASAFARQQAAIDRQSAEYDALRRSADSVAAGLKLLKQEADAAFIGPRRDGLKDIIRGTESQLKSLEGQAKRTGDAITRDLTALDRSRASLQQIGSTAIAAEQAKADIDQMTAALRRQTDAAERNARVLATIESTTGITRDSGELAALNEQIQAEQRLIDKLRAEQEAQNELNRARERGAALSRQVMGVDSGKSAQSSAAVFDAAFKQNLEDSEGLLRANAAAERDMAAAAQRLRAEINPLGVIQDRLNKELAEANALYRAGKITATELAQAQKVLAANADRAAQAMGRQTVGGTKPTLFGLKPYDIQNLGFQVNDVVTQLASGTSLTQTLAQQGGQLIQIFPRVGAAIVGAFTNPVILATVAAVGALVLGLNRAASEARNLRELEGALLATGNSAGIQASQLQAAAKEIDRYGLSAKEAVSIVRTFAKEGLNPELFVEFGIAAKDMADVLSIDVADAAKQLAQGFSGGYDAIKRLDDATSAFTATELQQIRVLFESGRAQEARTRALEIFTRRQNEAAEKMRGSWSEAARSLGNAWDSFLNYLANTRIVQGMASALDDLADSAKNLFDALSGAETKTLDGQIAGVDREIAEAKRQLDQLRRGQANFERNGQRGGILYEGNLQRQRDLAQQIVDLEAKRNGLIEQRNTIAAPQDTVSAGSDERQKTRDAELARIEREREEDAQKRLTGEQRIVEAGRLAYEASMRRYGDEAIAQAERQLAIDRERASVEAEIARDRERANREGATFLGQTMSLLRETEGFRSRAYWDVNAYRVGFGSDTVTRADGRVERVTANTTVTLEDAIRDLERRIGEFGDVVKSQIGSERFNAFNAQQQAVLTSIAYNYGSLPDRILDEVKNGTIPEIAAAIRGLGGDNNGVNRGRRNREAALFEVPNLRVEADNQENQQEQLDRQRKFNSELDVTIAQRQREVEQARELVGLSGEQLIAKEREQAIEDVIAKARLDATKAGVDIDTPAFKLRLKLLEQVTGAYYDLEKARDVAEARRKAVEDPVNQLTAQRDALQQRITFLQEQGDFAGAEALTGQLGLVNAELDKAITAAQAFWTAMRANPEAAAALGLTAQQIDTIALKLESTRPVADNFGRQFLMTGKQINETFANGATQAFDRFAQAVANGEDVAKSLRDAFLQFASDFLRQIAQMIIKQAIFNAIAGASGAGGGGGLGSFISTAIGSIFHEGGVAGSSAAPTRMVDARWFQNAMRYHSGGVAGLKPGEVPAILEKGERIRTEEQEAALQRRLAGGGTGAATANVKNIIAFDPADALRMALNTKAGEQVMLTWVRDNSAAFGGAASG